MQTITYPVTFNPSQSAYLVCRRVTESNGSKPEKEILNHVIATCHSPIDAYDISAAMAVAQEKLDLAAARIG